jgi:hypothetical protein
MIARLLAFLLCLLACVFPALAQQEETKGVPAEPDNAAELRERVANVERVMPKLPDRGAALFFLAARRQRLGETREAISLLKESVGLREGFDPSNLRVLLEARRRFPIS